MAVTDESEAAFAAARRAVWRADVERAARRKPWLTKVKPQLAAGRAALRAGMWRMARREPWLTKVKPQPAAEHACRHEAVAGPTRRAWPAPTGMRPPLAASAHAHAWKRATQYGDHQTGRPGARSAQGWSRRRPVRQSWEVRIPCARPPTFKAAASRDRAAR
eukprot:6307560-Prymnesium_polylepis.1